MSRRLTILLQALLMGAFSSPAASAQEEFRQDTIVSSHITASRHQEKIIPAQTLSGERLSSLSANSVADAIRYFSGVQIKDYGGIGGLKTINVRSMGSHHVGVFYDGIEIGNAQNGVVDLGRFSLDNMEAVSLYNGQKSTIFQGAKDYACASAFHMQSKRPLFYGKKRDNLNIGLKAGSFDTWNPSLLWEHKLGKRLSLQANGEFMSTSGKYKFTYAKKDGYDTTAVRQNGDVRYERLEAALFGDVESGEWRAKLYFYDSERGFPGAFVREEPGKFRHQDRQWDDSFFLQGSFRKDFSSKYCFQAKGKYGYDYLHYISDPRLDVTTMYVDNRYRQQELYASVAHLYNPFRWWSLSLATDWQFNTLDADLVDFVYPHRNLLMNALATSFTFPRFKLQASLLHTLLWDRTATEDAHMQDRSEFSPSVVASWSPFADSGFNIRSFYKKIFRMPTFNELYYTFVGNKYLEPESTVQYDLGVVYQKSFSGFFHRVNLQADGYFNQVKNKIIAMPTSNQFRWTMINLGYVEIRGADISAEVDFTLLRSLKNNLHLSYAYQKAQDLTDPSGLWYGGQIPYVPLHSGSVVWSGEYKGWTFSYSFIYTGERYEAVANIPENYALPWYTSDLSFSHLFTLRRGGGLRTTAEINNLFNQQYEVVQCYPMPGINFKLKVNYIL